MPDIFSDVTLKWLDKEYVIKPDRMMGAIMVIEDVVTLWELQRDAARGTIKLAKIAAAYGAVLRYAGAKVTDAEIYTGMFGSNERAQELVTGAIDGLLSMMIPPASVQKEIKSGESPQGNRAARRAAASS